VVDYAREAGWILRDRHCYDRETLSNMPWNGILSIALRPALSDWIRQWDCPVVRMLCGTLPDDAPVVETDSCGIGAAGAEHLLSLGQKKYLYFSFRETDETNLAWNGFEETLLAAGRDAVRLTPPPKLLKSVGSRKSKREDVWRWLAEQLRSIPGPLAVMAEDDYFAGDVFEAAAIAGLNVPHVRVCNLQCRPNSAMTSIRKLQASASMKPRACSARRI
jgi:DNA-binding LacI/PurR family transcriptional regulator